MQKTRNRLIRERIGFFDVVGRALGHFALGKPKALLERLFTPSVTKKDVVFRFFWGGFKTPFAVPKIRAFTKGLRGQEGKKNEEEN